MQAADALGTRVAAELAREPDPGLLAATSGPGNERSQPPLASDQLSSVDLERLVSYTPDIRVVEGPVPVPPRSQISATTAAPPAPTSDGRTAQGERLSGSDSRLSSRDVDLQGFQVRAHAA
jgi:hypothetical protein